MFFLAEDCCQGQDQQAVPLATTGLRGAQEMYACQTHSRGLHTL